MIKLYKKAGSIKQLIGSGRTLRAAVAEAIDNGDILLFEDVNTLDQAVNYVETAYSDYIIERSNKK